MLIKKQSEKLLKLKLNMLSNQVVRDNTVTAVIEMEPTEGEYVFENAIVGGAIPKEYIPAIDNGIQEAAKNGIIAGYEVINFKS